MSDLIEREYLLNIARKEEAYGYVSEHEILNAPTAEPKVGKWLEGERVGYNGTYYYRYCSECLFERNDDDVDKDTPYCPNCGAKMERSE